jgi:hypothetical protein
MQTQTRHSPQAHERSRRRPQPIRSGPPASQAVLRLHGTAGNAGVATLLTGGEPTVQRGMFDMLGGLLGGGGGGLRENLAGLAGRGIEAGAGALGSKIGGPFGGLLSGTGAGLGGAASNLVMGNTASALSGLQGVGTSVAGPAAESAMGMLGGAIGSPAGGVVSGLGTSVGQGLSSIISGGSPAQAGMGVLNAAAPGLQSLAARFLGGI